MFEVTSVEIWDMESSNMIADFTNLPEAMNFVHNYLMANIDVDFSMLLTFNSGYSLTIDCLNFMAPE